MIADVEENRQSLPRREHPLLRLAEEELDFVAQFVLASGSLKEMAAQYRVSYPTIRASLDRLIANLRQHMPGAAPDPMTDFLADLVERGKISVGTAKDIRAVYRKAQEQRMEMEEQR